MARSRQEGYELLSALADAGLLRGVAFVHLKRDLDARPVDWLDCPDPSTPEQPTLLTTYGIRKDVQAALAAIRTDLDGFSDIESDALMLSGYRMMKEEFQTSIRGFPSPSPEAVAWRFLRVEKLASAVQGSPELEELKKTLEVARASAFKPYRISTSVKLVTWIAAAAALAGSVRLVASARGDSPSIGHALAVIALVAAVAAAAKFVLHRLLRNPNPLWQVLLAIPLLFLGWPLTWICTGLLDPIYLRSGPRCKE
jgi:hypothetical protein